MASQELLEGWDPGTCRRLRDRLTKWYRRSARPLPWRETHDPYRIWISEIMLQQTTVKAVVPYFERFLARFPTVQALAAATEEEVLQYWEGLGYYSRGRNLRRGAQVICEVHSGEFPRELELLQALPGIGRYTAGAIRSFAFDLPAPIVEANTLRLYCRLLGYDGDPRSREGQGLLWEFAEQLQPRAKAGIVNQALMELGAVICTPVAPRCDVCPVREFCRAAAEDRQGEIPRKATRAEVTAVVEGTIACETRGRYLVRQRQPGERWAGMWDFPRFPVESVKPEEKLGRPAETRLIRELLGCLQEQAGIAVGNDSLEVATEIRHSVTRYRIRLICLRGNISQSVALPSEQYRWVTLTELEQLPMPVTGRQFAAVLKTRESHA